MVDFSHGYTPPGVSVEEDISTSVTITGLPPARLALVGPGVGYRSNTEQVPLSTSLNLGKKGISLSSVLVHRVDTGALVDDDDYTLTASGSLTGGDYYTAFARSGGSATPSGTLVFVSYQYVPPEYYDPQLFDNYEDLKDWYGEPVNYDTQATGDYSYQPITSPLSLAALIAFQNGVVEIVATATTPPGSGATTDAAKSTARKTALATAYGKIGADPTISVVVPITWGILTADAAGAATDLRTHVISASNDSYARIGIIGFEPVVTTAPDTLISGSSLASKRLMLAYASPAGLQYFAGGANAAFAVGHEFLATAYGAKLTAGSTAAAITRQQIQSFTGIAGTPLSNSLKNQYAAAGVAVSEIDRRGRLVVRHGVTTDMTNINTREVSVVRSRDAMIYLIQNGLDDSGLIGSPIDLDTALDVKSIMAGLLEHCVALGIVIAYNDLGVRQTSADPTVIEVKFAYRPAYPLNYIVVSFSIDLSTGATTIAEAA